MQKKILVVGDIIVDQYSIGSVQRVSPEAPVPVVCMNKSYTRMGGAANVAANIVSLGGEAFLAGFIGRDDAGYEFKQKAQNSGISISCVVASNSFKTIEKMRVIGNNQQIVRLDFNDKQVVDFQDYEILIVLISNVIMQVDAVVISDYLKGVCTGEVCKKIIDVCRENDRPVFVDPKGKDWSKYSGATLISPNLKEVSEYLSTAMINDNEEIDNKCKSLCAEIGVDYLLVTRSEKGMTLIDDVENSIHIESKALDVYDVSGAGDTVIAALSYFWDKTNYIDAVKLANKAAGIVVGKQGTATVTMEELRDSESAPIKQIVKKIVEWDELKSVVKKWKADKETIAFTNGCFDIFHKGHAYLIYSASEYAEHLIVAVNSDSSVKRLKGDNRPINNEFDRAYVIAALGCVDYVIIFGEDTPKELLQFIKPDVLVKGGDYRKDEVVGREYAIEVVLVKYIEGYSTTGTIEKMKMN